MINTLYLYNTCRHTQNCLVNNIDEKIYHVRDGKGVKVI